MTTIVDTRGMRCPWPALRLARAMRVAEIVVILADDPAAPGEIGALAATNGWAVSSQNGGFLVSRTPAITIDLPALA
ncbi:MAG TPA: sulfurtransferase TusA family protein [Sphingomonas sp.]|nr:sulfurtransferase TusA family protein [Sphingomonas sp.]